MNVTMNTNTHHHRRVDHSTLILGLTLVLLVILILTLILTSCKEEETDTHHGDVVPDWLRDSADHDDRVGRAATGTFTVSDS